MILTGAVSTSPVKRTQDAIPTRPRDLCMSKSAWAKLQSTEISYNVSHMNVAATEVLSLTTNLQTSSGLGQHCMYFASSTLAGPFQRYTASHLYPCIPLTGYIAISPAVTKRISGINFQMSMTKSLGSEWCAGVTLVSCPSSRWFGAYV